MVSVQFKQEKHNALVSFLMIVIAVLFFYGKFAGALYQDFWKTIRENLLE